ncbi:hypothetical protein RBB79_18085 [Tunturiibacter empetritectus]|uniref:Uncharacterized protein n=1 Tax=Tunturiibacter lichenicola TaxID=2051959 RepID=A0A852VQE8_9BACT|nr:hypothetical protein [Edaphobacter lichenicola]NYF91562.1 hypothetical protein [Edaphobacter lichenicola]
MQLSIIRRGPALACDDHQDTAPLRAGDRAPDATKLMTVEGERRLFDLKSGGQFTLLHFGASGAVESSPFDLKNFHVVGQPIGSDDIVDSEGHLASAYCAADRTLVLVRPGGYMALISDAGDISAVSEYLATIG